MDARQCLSLTTLRALARLSSTSLQSDRQQMLPCCHTLTYGNFGCELHVFTHGKGFQRVCTFDQIAITRLRRWMTAQAQTWTRVQSMAANGL
jgi:hypothetical protein